MNNSDYSSDRFVSPQEFSEITGYPAWTVRYWCREGRIEHLRLGQKIRIPLNKAIHSLTVPAKQ